MQCKHFSPEPSFYAFEPSLSCAIPAGPRGIVLKAPKMGKTEFLTQEIKISWIGFPDGNPDQWKSKPRNLQYLSYTVQHEGCISLLVTKLPVAKEKKRRYKDYKSSNEKLYFILTFFSKWNLKTPHLYLESLIWSIISATKHLYSAKTTRAILRGGLMFMENPCKFPATIMLDGNGLCVWCLEK